MHLHTTVSATTILTHFGCGVMLESEFEFECTSRVPQYNWI